jgi:hypothetical protein
MDIVSMVDHVDMQDQSATPGNDKETQLKYRKTQETTQKTQENEYLKLLEVQPTMRASF